MKHRLLYIHIMEEHEDFKKQNKTKPNLEKHDEVVRISRADCQAERIVFIQNCSTSTKLKSCLHLRMSLFISPT